MSIRTGSFSLLLSIFLAAAPALAESPISLIQAGKYRCLHEGASPRFGAGAILLLQMARVAGGQRALLTGQNGFKVEGRYNSKFSAFNSPAFKGYFMISPASPDFSRLELTVATATAPGSYSNDGFRCAAEAPPVLTPEKKVAFECQTDSAFYDGNVHALRFILADLGIPGAAHAVALKGESEVLVKPANSLLKNLNENIVVGETADRVEIKGDSDGFILSDLVLWKQSRLTKGFVRIKDQTGGKKPQDAYGTISCQVR